MAEIAEARRWLNTAERAALADAEVPALIGIGYALISIAKALGARDE